MDSGSVTGAAAILRISQPAVTKALRLLEFDLGLQLFLRTTKGIAATDEARALYAEVERTYFGMQNLKRFAGGLRDRKQGRVVVTVPALSVAWLPLMAARFARTHPGVTLSLYSEQLRRRGAAVGRARSTSASRRSAARRPTSPAASSSTWRASRRCRPATASPRRRARHPPTSPGSRSLAGAGRRVPPSAGRRHGGRRRAVQLGDRRQPGPDRLRHGGARAGSV